MLELIAAERPDTVAGVPTMLIGMLDHPGFATTDTLPVRQLYTGGAVAAPALVGRVEAAFGAPVSIVFAQTEASPVITQTSPQDTAEDRAHTLGRPLPQTEVKIADPASGQTVAPGVIGELCTRGYHVMTGYFRDPEIEQVLFEHPTVADVAVVGVPDATWGEQVAAFVRPAPGHAPDPGELFAYCREHLAPHKTPRYWTVLEEFPLTPSGKVQKFMLRKRFLAPQAEGPGIAAAAPPTP